MKIIYTFILFTLFISPTALSQNKEKVNIMNDTLVYAAREIILSSVTCTLITLDDQGGPRARIMDVLPPDHDFTVWFGTNPKSRKVSQINNNPKVTLLYKDQDNSGYVMLSGTAEIISDPGEKEKRWKESWKPFYKDRANDFILIKVSPKWMEIVSNSRNIAGDPETWEPKKIWLGSSK